MPRISAQALSLTTPSSELPLPFFCLGLETQTNNEKLDFPAMGHDYHRSLRFPSLIHVWGREEQLLQGLYSLDVLYLRGRRFPSFIVQLY